MPQCMYYTAEDIQKILHIGKKQAYQIMHYFDKRGRLFHHGRTMRLRKSYFDEWLDSQDNASTNSINIAGKSI